MSKQVNLFPDRAATFVVHPTPGIGDATTIQEGIDLIVASGTGGGEIFLREGTYALAATVTLPDLPISIKGCGESTLISLGANAIPAFTIPNGLTQYRQYVFSNFNILGTSVANQRIVSVQDTSAFGQVNMSLVKSEGVQIAIDIPAGDTTFTRQVQIVTEDCWFVPIPANTGSILHVADAFFQVEWKADRIRFIDLEAPFGSPGVQGGSMVLHATPGVFINVEAYIVDSIFNITLDSTFGTAYFENCSFVNLTVNLIFVYILGSLTLLGQTSLINCHAENQLNINFNESANVVGGQFIDCSLVMFGTDPGGSVTGTRFSLGPTVLTVLDTASRSLLIDGCYFTEDAAVGGARYINMSVSSPGSNCVTNCVFEPLSAGSNSCISVGVTAGTRTAIISGNFFNSPNVPPWIEIGGTDGVRYDNNFFTATTLAPTIVGANSTFNGVQNKKVTGGVTTGVFVTQFTHVNVKGIIGVGTIKNTGGVNSMEVQETVTDIIAGTTDSRTTTVAPGNTLLLQPMTNIGTALPPYSSYAVAVRHPVAATTFNLAHSTGGAKNA